MKNDKIMECSTLDTKKFKSILNPKKFGKNSFKNYIKKHMTLFPIVLIQE